ncbi:MAG: serine/threonine protein kinase [Acidobacteriota bacterium]|nr:serine/threonine protein kinase [Acidobacteriota bacterium]
MRHMLAKGMTVVSGRPGERQGRVGDFLGSGGQGEVYRVTRGNEALALKWYDPEYLRRDPGLIPRLDRIIAAGPPSDRFLWPLERVTVSGVLGEGYLMPLREPRFRGLSELMRRRIEPSFRVLATAGFELAHNYLQLHAKGFCYRDISFGNVFFDPKSGEIRICDNDNVDVDGQAGHIEGTMRFMAPEIIRGESGPCIETDLFSLAVLLFYLLVVHHPLEGERELRIRCLDMAAMRELYGMNPLFIFDPHDPGNRPVAGSHDNALAFWPLYPRWLQELFARSFGDLRRCRSGRRVRESEWRRAMVVLRDAIVYCSACGAENFFDAATGKSTGHRPGYCWSCRRKIMLPAFVKIGSDAAALNHDTVLYPHHLVRGRLYDFSMPAARMERHPSEKNLWGLKNLGPDKWTAVQPDGRVKDVHVGASVRLKRGMTIHFAGAAGEVILPESHVPRLEG